MNSSERNKTFASDIIKLPSLLSNETMSNTSNNFPVGNGGSNTKLKPAPILFKQRQNSEATAATESSFISPTTDSQTGGFHHHHLYRNTGSSRMMSRSFGGGSSAFLSSMLTSTPPAPGVVQR
jgi:hypothetical protein